MSHNDPRRRPFHRRKIDDLLMKAASTRERDSIEKNGELSTCCWLATILTPHKFCVLGDRKMRREICDLSTPTGCHYWKARGRPFDRVTLHSACHLQMDELAHSHERELRALMAAGLDGDATAYHQLLERLTSHLRAYYRSRFARIGRGPTDAEDLLQEALIAVHTHRHTYDRSQPSTPWINAIAR
jgi:Sigma-70 region 2